MKGVILAAGDGDRMGLLTRDRPKVLVPVQGRPMIDYTLEAFVEAGISDLVVVVGYRGEMVQQWVGDGRRYGARVEYVFNADYEAGNGISLYAAREQVVERPFILAMADHMIGADMLRALLASSAPWPALCVDFSAEALPQLSDATRVLVDEEGRIVSIGKDLERWNGVDAGVFLLDDQVFRALEQIRQGEVAECNLSSAIFWLTHQGDGIRACDISGCFWMDVDTPADLSYVEDLFHSEAAPLV